MSASPSARAERASQSLLVLSRDAAMRSFFAEQLAEHHAVGLVGGEEELLDRLRKGGDVALVIVDHDGGDPERAFSLMERIQEIRRDLPVVMMMKAGDEEVAVEALKRGFVDYIAKREDVLQADLIRRRIAANLELASLRRENEALHAAIEASQQRLFNIYDSLDDAIVQIDEDCRIVSANRSAAALANCEPREAVGKVCWEVFDFHPCERRAKKEECHVYQTFLEGETLRGERQDARSGTTQEYMTFITTLEDRDYVVYRETDVTEKRRLEERIANALRSLGVKPPEDAEDG